MKAKSGQQGGNSNMTGKSGEDLVLTVPPGTQVIDEESGEVLLDLKETGEKVLFLSGGKGGLGNARFKSSTNQRPTYAQPGMPGETKTVQLELKLIADVGLVGFPNVGKSTLISTISSAKPEVANYEFTTLTPKLGVVDAGNYNSFVMADIPGIIEGASDGRGLGLEFLRHIERTEFLLFMIDIANYRTLETQLEILKEELTNYSQMLSTKRYGIALTKVDALSDEEAKEKIVEFFNYLGIKNYEESDHPYYIAEEDAESPVFVLPISAVSYLNTKKLIHTLYSLVRKAV